MADQKAVRLLEGVYVKVDRQMREILAHQPVGIRVVDVAFVIGVNGVPLAVGDHTFLRLGLNGEAKIVSWSLGATDTGVATNGAVTVDVLVGATLATVATICPTGKPALAAQSSLAEQVPTAAWTLAIPDASWVMAKATAVDGNLEVVNLTLRCTVT